MSDLFKKLLYTGVGLATSSSEKVKQEIDTLVERGKLSEEEGKKVVDDVVRNFEVKKEEFEGKLSVAVEKVLDKLNLPSLDYVEKLEKRIKSLEVKVGLLHKELDKQTATAAKD
jgi:polyhydroxyalkanoate synthesis regulator phasin